MKTYQTIDKSAWGDGPWQNEPDEIFWRQGSYECLIRRSHFSGAFCGYVVLPRGHRLEATPARDLEHIRVHGGVTFSSELNMLRELGTVEIDLGRWAIGFDAAHPEDYSPGFALNAGINPFGDPRYYRDVEFMKRQLISLAAQCTGKPILTIKAGAQ